MSIDPIITNENWTESQTSGPEAINELDESIKNLFCLGPEVVVDFFNNKFKKNISNTEECSKVGSTAKKTEITALNIVFPMTDNILTSIPRGSFLPNSPLLQFNDSPRNSPINSPLRSSSPYTQPYEINLENLSGVALFHMIKFPELGYSKFLKYMDNNKNFSKEQIILAANNGTNYHQAMVDPYIMRNLSPRAKKLVFAAQKNALEFEKYYNLYIDNNSTNTL